VSFLLVLRPVKKQSNLSVSMALSGRSSSYSLLGIENTETLRSVEFCPSLTQDQCTRPSLGDLTNFVLNPALTLTPGWEILSMDGKSSNLLKSLSSQILYSYLKFSQIPSGSQTLKTKVRKSIILFSSSSYYFYLFIYFWQYWGLNSGLVLTKQAL
jgi:hypothetical protein